MPHTTKYALYAPRRQGVAQDIYIDPVGGNNDAHGTISDPIQTHTELDRRIPDFNDAVTRVFLKSGAPHVLVPMRTRFGNASIVFASDPVWDAGAQQITQVSTAALGGTTATVTKASGLVTNQFRGHTIEYTSGPATGHRRTIRDNTATDINVCFNFVAIPLPTNTYIIYRPGVILDTTTSLALTGDGWDWISYYSNISGSDNPNGIALMFAGLRFQEVANRQCFMQIGGNCRLAFYGCEYETLFTRRAEIDVEGMPVVVGCDDGGVSEAHLPALLGITNITQWAGWGFADISAVGSGLGIFGGDMQTNAYVASRLTVRRMRHAGGSILATGTTAAVVVQPSTLGPGSYSTTGFGGVPTKIEQTGTGIGVFVGSDSVAGLASSDITTASGDAIFVQGNGSINFSAVTTIGQSATGKSVHCQEGRVIITGGTPVFGDAAALDYDVGNGSPQNKSFFASAGDSMVNLADLSMIKRRT